MNTLRRSLSDLALGDTVTVLDVSYGNHKSLPKKITKMKNLETLNASGNDLDEIKYDLCRNFPDTLESIDLSGNKLVTLPESFGTCLRRITRLDLSFNMISVMPFAAIYSLHSLKYLNMSNNGLCQIVDGIANLKRLEELSLECNNISVVTPELGLMKNLKKLNLSRNMLKTLPKDLSHMDSIEIIDLSYNVFTEIPQGLATIKSKQLHTISMSYNSIEVLGGEIMKALSNTIRSLDFSYNKILTVTDDLTCLQKIELIDLTGNKDITEFAARSRSLQAIRYDWTENKALLEKNRKGSLKQTDEELDCEAPMPPPRLRIPSRDRLMMRP